MILVTGGSGFIGGHLIKKLLEEDFPVYAIDLIHKQPFNTIGKNFRFRQGNIADTFLAGNIMKEIKIVVHLAAISSAQECQSYPTKAIDTNITGTQRLIEAAIMNNVRSFIFISSAAVYGDNGTKIQVEHSQLVPKGIYGFTKMTGEELCRMYARTERFNPVILRLFNVYGLGSTKNAVIPRFVSDALKGEKLFIKGGYQTRDFIHVSDVVEAIMLMVKKSYERPDNLQVVGTFNIGTGESSSIDRIAAMINSILISREMSSVDYRIGKWDPTDIFNSCADITKIQEQFGFELKVKLREGIEELFDYYMEQD